MNFWLTFLTRVLPDVENCDLLLVYDVWRNGLYRAEPGTLIVHSQIHVDFNSFNK
jgi:hypothetical protein